MIERKVAILKRSWNSQGRSRGQKGHFVNDFSGDDGPAGGFKSAKIKNRKLSQSSLVSQQRILQRGF
jgi:hypothetical protein